MPTRTRFAVIGINHSHLFAMTDIVRSGGGELTAFYAEDETWAADYGRRYPAARRVSDKREILEDETIALVLSAGIPSERAATGIEVMRHGKDYCCDKAAFLNREDLDAARRVQAETGKIFSICYSERLLEPGAWKAGQLVRAGAIGRVLHTAILAPHALRISSRAPWFFERRHYGGILTDIGSHQIEQFLTYSDLESAEVVSSQVANYAHPEYPEFEDFGEVLLRGRTSSGSECSASIRVDWLIPPGATRSGRYRTLLGTEGVLEIEHSSLILSTSRGTERLDCTDTPLDFGRLLVDDVLNRTQTAMGQEHGFYASELTLNAQMQASRAGYLQTER
ncbi:MAG: Gfo/Idh/MocA family oxidoreductase [Cytophagales bacterium]|nr:Gfo/Idh/MocA family oxidoreductase [Armatimonadota bacterium]